MKETKNVDKPADMRSTQEKRILVMTSVTAERDAVLRGLRDDSRFDVRVGGVGPVTMAASTATVLATDSYDLVVNAGIAGGFVGKADIGTLAVASEIIAADLGAQSPEGFLSLDELGFGSARVAIDKDLATQVTEALQAAGLTVIMGPILTLSTVTGTAATADELTKRVPGATAEAMEGFGVATAASQHGVPVLEIRAISNAVGPRDRSAWRIPDALKALEAASTVLAEVLR